MTAPNHLVGGFTFTGVFGSIMGLNILSDWKYIVVIGFAALLPDIDHTKSIIGKMFFPLAKFLNQRYGHRTITHSLFFLISTSLLVSAIQNAFFPSIPLAKLYFLALLSHLIFDMMTVQGVPLFYPFLKNSCVIPGNPYMRLRTGDLRSETIVLCFFIVSAFFMKPLIKNGFWTSYNRLFGSLKHLKSEFNKSDDMLLVNYSIQEGSELIVGSGLCVDTDESKMTLLEGDSFVTLPKSNQIVKEVIPNHSGLNFRFEKVHFSEIDIDSLFTEILQYRITAIDIYANNKFRYKTNGRWKDSKTLKLKYLNNINIEEIPNQLKTFQRNPVIEKLKYQIIGLQEDQNLIVQKYKAAKSEYDSAKKKYQGATNDIEREIFYEQNSKLKEPSIPLIDNSKIKELEIKIKELQYEDRLKLDEYQSKITDAELKLSGFYERIIIE